MELSQVKVRSASGNLLDLAVASALRYMVDKQDNVFSLKDKPLDKLGDINARLAPVALTVDGLAHLGFAHVATDKSAKLYRASDFQAMCAALVKHITDVGINHA